MPTFNCFRKRSRLAESDILNILWECSATSHQRIIMDRWKLKPHDAFHRLLDRKLISINQLKDAIEGSNVTIPTHVLDILLSQARDPNIYLLNHKSWLWPLSIDKIDVMSKHGIDLNQTCRKGRPLIDSYLLTGLPGRPVNNPVILIDRLGVNGWSLDQPFINGNNLLHLIDDRFAIFHLLELGLNPDQKNRLGQTAMMINRPLRYVVDAHPTKKVNLAIQDRRGNTILHRDVIQFADELIDSLPNIRIKDIQKLIDLGARTEELNEVGSSSLDLLNERVQLNGYSLNVQRTMELNRLRTLLTF